MGRQYRTITATTTTDTNSYARILWDTELHPHPSVLPRPRNSLPSPGGAGDAGGAGGAGGAGPSAGAAAS